MNYTTNDYKIDHGHGKSELIYKNTYSRKEKYLGIIIQKRNSISYRYGLIALRGHAIKYKFIILLQATSPTPTTFIDQ